MSVCAGEERERRDHITNLLAKVQDDLRLLREDIQDHVTRGDPVDVEAIQVALNQIESNITDKTEELVSRQFQAVSTLPVGLPDSKQLSKPLHLRSKSVPPPHLSHSSPGQEAQLLYISKLLSQPTHPATRQVLSDAFGIPLTEKDSKNQRIKKHDIQKRLMPIKTVPQRTPLPLINRRDPRATHPVISSRDAQHGILNLLERGLIPRAADIVLYPSPVKPKAITLQKFSKHDLKAPPIDNFESRGVWAGIKFDFSGYSKYPLPGIPGTATISKQPFKYKPPQNHTLTVHTLPPIPSDQEPHQRVGSRIDVPVHREKEVSFKNVQSKITIRGGSILQDGDYEAVKTENASKWDMMLRILGLVEEMARNYAIPVIFVGAQKAIHLAEEYDLEPDPKYRELIPCVLNAREVDHLLSTPGRRYKGHRGIHAAATKIQATYRMYVRRCQYLHYRKMKWASGVIAMGWMLHMKVQNSKKYLKKKQELSVTNYRSRLKELGENWETFHNQKRFIIHIPSKGYPTKVRKSMQNFFLAQAFQLPRIFDVFDPNVEVIYVSPIEIGEEVKEYNKQLLDNVKGGTQSGSEMWNRIHFVVPDSLDSFGLHNLSLSTFLKYSPMALQRIKNMIGSHPAILVPHVPLLDDLALADQFNIPVMGTEPNLVHLYSTFSGRRALFKAAFVPTPPHLQGVYSAEQLVEGLTSLIINYPYYRRWIFKLDHHCQGNGIAYCDIADHLDCHQWILSEKARYGDKWKKQWAQERARRRVLSQLPTILANKSCIADRTIYDNWSHFVKEFLASGGTIEGHAPSDNVTSLTAEIYLKPNKTHTLLSTWDHILSEPFKVWGGSMPQTSVDYDDLSLMVDRIAKAAFSRGLVGHISVDFVTFIDPETMSQVTWAVDLDFGPSDMVYMSNLASGMAGLTMPEWSTGQSVESTPQYYMVASTRLKHVNLSVVQYSVFFQMCKAHLIGFNNKTSTGTLFTLIESKRKHNLGMICLQQSLKESLVSASRALSVVHQEISTAADTSDVSNFSMVCKAIDGLVEQL